jgi:hypothetical protein
MSRRMPFGKHRGERLEDVPFEYLEWLTTLTLREPLRSQVEDEYERRTDSQETKAAVIDSSIVDELVGAGVRTLSTKYHPDLGGDHDRMVAINQAADWLRQHARSLAA